MVKEIVKQAVILLDTFNENFKPCEVNSCFLPIVNERISDYMFEWLGMSGVEEIILFTSNSKHIQDGYVHRIPTLQCPISYVVSQDCYSLGDVMRTLDSRAVIRNNFILIPGDVIGNVNFKSIFEKFEEIQNIDKGISMMMIYENVGKDRYNIKNDSIIGINSSNKLLYYQNLSENTKVDLPVDVLLENNILHIRNDVVNTSVAICSAAVPALYSDNFDFQTQEDLIKEILTNADVLSNTLYCNILEGTDYIAKVDNWPAYQRITCDIIRRWIYPIVPDLIEKYHFRRNFIYLSNQTTISKGCVLKSDVVIGNNSTLEDNVYVTRSVIGKGCKIGKNSVLKNVFIFNNTTILENCIITDSVISNDCYINTDCKIEEGCILGPNIKLEVKTELRNVSLISQNSVPKLNRLTRFNNNCFIYKSGKMNVSESDDDDINIIPGLLYNKKLNFNDISDSEASDDDSSSTKSLDLDDIQIFYNEVFDSLSFGYEDKLKCEDMIVEINSSRYAYNITVNEVNFNVMKAILSIKPRETSVTFSSIMLLQYTLTKLNFFFPMLKNYIKDSDAQCDCLNAIADVATHDTMLKSILLKVLSYLYDKDIFSEEIIIKWYNSFKNESIKETIYPFLKWLEEAEEETESESD